jgi:hypothetical protein
VVIGTDFTGNCKSNYHMITTKDGPCIKLEQLTKMKQIKPDIQNQLMLPIPLGETIVLINYTI